MVRQKLPNNARKQKIGGFVLLAAAAIVTILLLFATGRRFVYGVFGYAVYAYLVGAYLMSILLIIGKSPKIKGSKIAIYVLLFFAVVLTIHIGLSADLIPSGRYLEDTYKADTVGGLLMALPASLLHLYPNYTFMLVVSFVITAIFGFVAIYPIVSKIGTGSVKKNKKEDKEFAKSRDLNEDMRIGKAFESSSSYVDDSVLNASEVRDNYFETLINNEERTSKRAGDVLFRNEDPVKPSRREDYSVLRELGEDDAIYTNQGRTRIMQENLALKSPEEEYAERYGGGKIEGQYAARNMRSSDIESQFVPRMPVSQDPYVTSETVDKNFAKPVQPKYVEERVAPTRPVETYASVEREEVVQKEQTAFEKLYATPVKYMPVEEEVPVRKVVPEVIKEPEYKPEPVVATSVAPRGEMSEAEKREYLFKPVTATEFDNMGLFKDLLDDEKGSKKDNYPDDAVAVDYEPEEEYEEPVAVKPAPVAPVVPRTEPKPIVVDKKPVYTSNAMAKEKAPDLKPGMASGVVQNGMFPDAPKAPYKPKPYKAPGLDLLEDYGSAGSDFPDDYQEVKQRIDVTMQEFNVPAEVINAKRGPTFTMYYLSLGPGYKITRVTNLKENLKMRLRVKNLRIQAPIEGEDAFGIELPNSKRDIVGLKTILGTREFLEDNKGIKIALGKTFDGRPFVADLAKMPHLLVAGATGTGKSVFLNSVIVSILYKYSPEDVRMIMIDPKRVEMAVYRGLPNLLIKETVKEAKHAVNVLKWLTEEMDRRYAFFEQVGCSNIEQYNDVFRNKETEPKMHRIVLIIDEMADLMIKSKDNKVEEYIVRIAQLARACGIHMIIATQRPTAEVITGLIKGNILHRVAFTVKSNLDSRVILDDGGAEELLGYGDMLYSFPGSLLRLQGTMIDIREIKEVCDYIRAHNDGDFDDSIMEAITYEAPAPEPEIKVSAQEERDADFEQQLRVILKSFILSGRASVSSAQASHHVGYIKARKLVDAMTERGFLSKGDGAKPRDIMISLDRYYEIFGQEGEAPGSPTAQDTFDPDAEEFEGDDE